METKKDDLFAGDIRFSVMSESAVHDLGIEKRGGAYRLRNGRYASKVDALEDKYRKRLSWLEFEREKYLRAWLSVCGRLSMVERENREIKQRLLDIVNGFGVK